MNPYRHVWAYKLAPHLWTVRHFNNCMDAHFQVRAGVLRRQLLPVVLRQELDLLRAWSSYRAPVLPR